MSKQQYVFAHEPEKHQLFQTLRAMAADRGIESTPALDDLLVAVASAQVNAKKASSDNGNECGFYAAMGMCGVPHKDVAGYYKKYRAALDVQASANKPTPGFVCLEDDYEECM